MGEVPNPCPYRRGEGDGLSKYRLCSRCRPIYSHDSRAAATVLVKVIAMTRLARVGRFAPGNGGLSGWEAWRRAIPEHLPTHRFMAGFPFLPEFAIFPSVSRIGSGVKDIMMVCKWPAKRAESRANGDSI